MHPGTNVVVTVISCMPDFRLGQRASALHLSDLHQHFHGEDENITEIVQLVIIPRASASLMLYSLMFRLPEISIIIQDDVLDITEYVVSV